MCSSKVRVFQAEQKASLELWRKNTVSGRMGERRLVNTETREEGAAQLGKGRMAFCIVLCTVVRNLEFILNMVDVTGGF